MMAHLLYCLFSLSLFVCPLYLFADIIPEIQDEILPKPRKSNPSKDAFFSKVQVHQTGVVPFQVTVKDEDTFVLGLVIEKILDLLASRDYKGIFATDTPTIYDAEDTFFRMSKEYTRAYKKELPVVVKELLQLAYRKYAASEKKKKRLLEAIKDLKDAVTYYKKVNILPVQSKDPLVAIEAVIDVVKKDPWLLDCEISLDTSLEKEVQRKYTALHAISMLLLKIKSPGSEFFHAFQFFHLTIEENKLSQTESGKKIERRRFFAPFFAPMKSFFKRRFQFCKEILEKSSASKTKKGNIQ